MARIAVIDLGEVPAGPVLDDTPARPRRHRRWALAAVVLGLALVILARSTPPPRPLPMAVLAAPTGVTVSVAGGTLVVADPDRPVGRRHVAAYRLTDLRQLWRVELPMSGEAHQLMAVDGTIVLAAGQPDNDGSGPSTVALDAATGAVRWREQAALNGPAPGGRLVLSVELPGQRLRAVHADTGALAWSVDLPAGATRSYRFDGGTLDLLAVILPSGKVELRDAGTGKLLRSGQIDRLSAVGGADRYAEIIGDLLLLAEGSWMVAYGLDRLDVRWRMPFSVGRDGWPVACGTHVCFLREGGGVTVVDQATGRHEWSDARWSGVLTEVDGYLIVSGLWHDEQILVAVDPDTGQVRRALGSWQEVNLDSAAGPIGVRYERDRTLVARLDPARGTRILDVLHDIVNQSCWAQSSWLLCWRTDNTVGIWRLPR